MLKFSLPLGAPRIDSWRKIAEAKKIDFILAAVRWYYSARHLHVASLIIFVLGVFVGKGIEARKLQQKEEPLVRIPVKPSAQQSGPAPVSPQSRTRSHSMNPHLNGLLRQSPRRTNLKRQDPSKRSSRRKETGDRIQRSTLAASKSPEKKAEKSRAAGETPKKSEPAESTEQKDQDKVWRAQVNAFPDERSAKQIVDRLKNKGYNAYVTEVQNRGKSWFRVSVGKYNSREEAEKMVEALRSKENFPKAFVASR